MSTSSAAASLPAAIRKRGTKQTCDSDDCGRRFYDLNKTPMACPYCGSADIAPLIVAVDITTYVPRGKAKPYRFERVAPAPVEEVAAAEAPAAEIDDTEVEADPNTDVEIPEIDADDLEEDIAGVPEAEET